MTEDWTTRLAATMLRDPGRPRLTWYGTDGERVELSGAVLVNWVSKTANLLVEEFDAGPGTSVHLDLPLHWRTVCWALAAWQVGACVAVGDADCDVLVSDRPPSGDRPVVAVALGALARRFDGALPPGAFDAAAVLAGFADTLGPHQAPRAGDPALADPLRTWPVDEPPVADDAPARRTVLRATATVAAAQLARVRALLAADGSVVLVGPGHAAHGTDDAAAAALEHLVATERADRVEGFDAG